MRHACQVVEDLCQRVLYCFCHHNYLLFIFQFFATKPYACEPSSLPKYPPSKEMDAKLRDEEARRCVCHLRCTYAHIYVFIPQI